MNITQLKISFLTLGFDFVERLEMQVLVSFHKSWYQNLFTVCVNLISEITGRIKAGVVPQYNYARQVGQLSVVRQKLVEEKPATMSHYQQGEVILVYL